MILALIKIILFIVLGSLSSISDIRTGLVSNKLVLSFSAVALIADIIGWMFFDNSYCLTQLINIGIVWLISVLLYVFHIWAGGDCKLMMVVALLIPYELYMSFTNGFAALMLTMAFAFGFGYLYLIYDTIVFAVKRHHKISKEKFIRSIKIILLRWIACISYIAIADQFLTYFFPDFFSKFSWAMIVINICIILIVSGIRVLSNTFVVLGVVILNVVIKLIFKMPVLSPSMLAQYLMAVAFLILRQFIDQYDYDTIPVEAVKKGMILSLSSTLLFVNSQVVGLPGPSTEDLRSRLTEEEVASIKRWSQTKKGTDSVEIVRKMPFAVFIAFGSALFVILGAVLK